MSKKIFIKTYGCQMNEYDSARIQDLFLSTGEFEMTLAPEQADLILLNSCSIREKASEKMFSDLGRYRVLKRKKPQLMIGVGGCVASQQGEDLLKKVPFVDILFGPQTLHRLLHLYEEAQQKRHAAIDLSEDAIDKFECLPDPQTSSPQASVTIMEGCDNFCSYCVVPLARGKEVSRSRTSVLREIETLVTQGVREITLLGQNVNHYYDDQSGCDFADLLRAIHAFEHLKRIRFMTSNPLFFSDKLIAIYKDLPKVLHHLHLPVQSGSNRILTAMNRGYTVEEYKTTIQKLKNICPDIKISSDFIVGFPCETEADFEATLNLAQQIEFDHSFSFIYSPRAGTPAAQLKDDVSLATKKERLKRLQHVLRESEQKISQQMMTVPQSILVLEQSKKDPKDLMGRTDNNRTVHFAGDSSLIGQLVSVKIIALLYSSLRGELA